ncbi:MAG: AAA family ATPase [Sulfolobaceae archaeon]
MINKITIRNFKSLESVDVNLKKINVLIGPNGSGKTAFVESLLLSRNIISKLLGYSPFGMWWGYENVVYKRDTSRSIVVEFNSDEFYYTFKVNGDAPKFIAEYVKFKDLEIDRAENIVQINGKKVADTLKTDYSIFSPFNLVKLGEKVADSLSYVLNYISNIIILHINPSDAISPVHSTEPTVLNINGRGMTKILHNLYLEGKLPGFLEEFLEEEGYSISFRISDEGNIILYFNDNGTIIPPPSVPSGLVKMLTILTAISLKPKVLAIDEIENSLHLKYIERLLDILDNFSNDTQIILTTHSPLVIDLVKPSDLIILYKEGSSTKIRRVNKKDEELRNYLVEKGITLSDAYFYGVL